MTPPNPSSEAREAALKIERMVINWIAGEKNNCGLAAIEAIIQAAIDNALSASAARATELQAELTAERERRIAAEDIVDRSLAHFPEKKLRALAHGYRLKYPK